MNEMQQYHIDGFIQKSFKTGQTLDRLNQVIQEIRDGQVRAGYGLVEKYKGSADMRPSTFEYDPVFLDILFENNIPQKLEDITGRNLTLSTAKLRLASFSRDSYMDWHRDSFFYKPKRHIVKRLFTATRKIMGKSFINEIGRITGPIPPVHKIIYYPRLDQRHEPALRVIAGSHHRIFTDRTLDKLQTKYIKSTLIESSNSKFLIFNISLHHGAIPVKNPKGAFRLIYSFAHKDYLDKTDGESQRLNKAYEERKQAGN
jgi:hypothetical protein